jgi:hypothetical protein
MPFSIQAWTSTEYVKSEDDICAHARFALHKPVEEVAHKLGVSGCLEDPHGNIAIIGEPNFSWVTSTAQPHPKLIVRVSTMHMYCY